MAGFQAIQDVEIEVKAEGEKSSFDTAFDFVNNRTSSPKSTTICGRESLIKHLQSEVLALRTELQTQRKTSV